MLPRRWLAAHGHKGVRRVFTGIIGLHRLACKSCSSSVLCETLDQIPLGRCTAEVMNGASDATVGAGFGVELSSSPR